ncbi:putative pentapeptide [Medicago truncatula]|uniref:Putative pentapeptide n=1 Tax=Medicago truncatula TaxID=3880 RepID=A0A072V034_MEDTR|nr:thylakoid lumenal 15 kDa protein 1, chloroplastic isoform X1 [Medicago truncatula]KEH34748.1 thylakoid lumenal 15 kDa protein [Medicago truncatula]RHN68285.1 putative pentapeptide [Medicago truncatula]
MALFLNASLPSTSKPHHHLLRSTPSSSTSSPTPLSLFLGTNPKQNHQASQKLALSLGESVSSAALVALLSASLFFVDPALAFKGGGPYGQGVTRGQDLSGKDFSGKTLIKQDFKTSILRQANFKGAKLLGASFFDADLTGADLSDTDLRSADFSLANVTKVNLSNANLEGALVTGNTSFKGSNITGADFTDVPLREDQREFLCKIADGVNSTTGNATRDTLLCN